MTQQLKILIVEDDPIIAQLIEHHLQEFGHQVLDIAHDSERALDLIHNLKPELVILDINIDGTKDGIDIATIMEDKYNVPYIFLTALSDQETLDRAANVKPLGYVVKPFKASNLKAAISIGISNYKKQKSKKELNQDIVNQIALSPLSFKEYKVLIDLSKGLTNVQIAQQLDVSSNTIKWHTQNIYSKLGVANRTAAAQLVMSL